MGLNDKSGLTPDMLKVYEQMPGMYLILSADLTIITASKTYFEISGINRAEMIGKNFFEVFPIEPTTGVAESLVYVQQNKIPHQIPVIRFDTPAIEIEGAGLERYWKTSHTPILDDSGEISHIIHHTQDVTELIASKKDNHQRKNDVWKLNLELVEANEEIRASNEELIATNEELTSTQQNLRELNTELERRVSDRTFELRLAQSEAERQRERLKRFFMQSPAGICILDGPEFVFELINPPYQELFPGREFLGKRLVDALPEVKAQDIIEIINQVYKTGKTYEGNGLLVPLAREENGPIENRFFNFIYQARLNAQGEIDGILAFVFEVTNMIMAEQKIEKNEKHLDFLLNAMPQQVWTAKPDGSLNYVNEVVCKDFGQSAEAIVGEGWQKFIHPADLAYCLEAWRNALETRTEYVVEFRLLISTGLYVWHLGRAIPFLEDGQIKLWMGTNTDIDLQKTNEQKKDEFISIASHELKTPLTSIKAFNQLMQRTGDLGRMNGFLKKSQQNISRLEKLIDDLLDVTKINAGKVNYTIKGFNFAEMLRDSIEGIQYISQDHEIVLTKNEEVIFNGDRFRIEQVLNNFLSNAVKYSPQGGKVIVKSEIQLNSIIVSVQDFGIGIAEQELSRLFDRYYRVDNTSMRFEGLGLGLFISSEILKRHHGSFWLQSSPGEGSTFYFRLPLSGANKLNPVVRYSDFYKDQSITVAYNKPANRLDVDWTGYQTFESVKNGGNIMLEMLRANSCQKIVNDNTHVLGTWSEASDWLREDWFPAIEKAGLKYFAWVYGKNVFSQLSAQKSIDVNLGEVVAQFFTEVALAEKWIDRK